MATLNRQRSRSISMPPPIGGMNVSVPINQMPREDAVNLVNWIPQQYGVRCRKGYVEWATNLGAACHTIMEYQPPIGAATDFELFAVTDDDIFDITATTDAPVSVFTMAGAVGGGRMNSLMYTNTAGSFLVMCSFQGGYITYDGTTWTQRVAGAGVGEINGVDPDQLVYVASWKRRLWFVEAESTNAWYLDTDAIAGNITKLELGPFVKNGGKLLYITNWTIDAGEGIDDFIVFVFEGGDVLVYKGTDPSSAADFSIVGSFFIGRSPPGRRNFTQFGGDVLILSELGLQPLSYVTRGGQSLLRIGSVDYTKKIQPRLAELVSRYSTYEGFDLTLFSKENMLVVDIPAGPNNQKLQYVLETNLNGWCMFTGMGMNCSAVAGNTLWFGTEDGKVCKALTGFYDNVPYGSTVGDGIFGVIQPAYSYFGAPGIFKLFMMVRPTFQSIIQPGIQVSMAVDFKAQPSSGSPIVGDVDVGIWDDPAWDLVQWGGAYNTYNDWVAVEGLGFAGAAYFKTQCAGDTFLVSIDYMYEFGGPI